MRSLLDVVRNNTLCGVSWMKIRSAIFRLLNNRFFLACLRQCKGNGITVLCFHRVSPEYSPAWPPLKPEVFEGLLKYLTATYQCILPSMTGIEKKGKKQLILTFDDGYKDNLIFVAPLLEKYNLKAVFSVVTGTIDGADTIWTQRLNKILEAYLRFNKPVEINGKDWYLTADNIDTESAKIFLELLDKDVEKRDLMLAKLEDALPQKVEHTPMMTWADLRHLSESGHEIASHTASHINLATEKNSETVVQELLISKKAIENNTGNPCETIAFPNGSYNDSVIRASLDAGYKNLLLVDEKLCFGQPGGTYRLIPRIMIQHETLAENLLKVENFHNIVKKNAR